LRPEGLRVGLSQLAGPSDYQAHLGANSGGANGVFWLKVLGAQEGGVLVENLPGRGKRHVAAVRQVIEPDLLYPLVRWSDVTAYRARPSAHLLLTQDIATRRGIDEAAMQARYPRTYEYLQQFRDLLCCRAAYRRYQAGAAWYSMYNVGRYTVAPVKVVWRRMDRQVRAAVAELSDDPLLGPRPVIPQETCVLVAADTPAEAHYVCAVVNSAVARFLAASHGVRGGKGFGTPGILEVLRIRRYRPGDPLHEELAASSVAAHAAARSGLPLASIAHPLTRARRASEGLRTSYPRLRVGLVWNTPPPNVRDGTQSRPEDLQHQIDRLAGRLWGLSPAEVDLMRREADA